MNISTRTELHEESVQPLRAPAATPTGARPVAAKEFERVVQTASRRARRWLRRTGIVIALLVIGCVIMAAVVWWRLLT